MSKPLMTFPTPFSLKAMGEDRDEFSALVVEIVRRHVPDLAENAVSHRPSRGGKYLSVTVTFVAESKQQLDNIYLDLSQHKEVLMVL
jgi:putative lipoic acid-binding regulatory protein